MCPSVQRAVRVHAGAGKCVRQTKIELCVRCCYYAPGMTLSQLPLTQLAWQHPDPPLNPTPRQLA